MNAINPQSREEATHVGVVESYVGTNLFYDIHYLTTIGKNEKIKFIFAVHEQRCQRGVVESMAYLIQDEFGWRIPNSFVYFSYIDGEMSAKAHLFNPIYLDLESVRKL